MISVYARRSSFARLALGAVALGAGCCIHGNQGGLETPPAATAPLVIDAHAHIVNGQDVPMAGFVQYVWASDNVPSWVPTKTLLALLEDVILNNAPSYAEERASLCDQIRQKNLPAPPACAAPSIVTARARPLPVADRAVPQDDRAKAYLLERLTQDSSLNATVLKSLQDAKRRGVRPNARMRTMSLDAATASAAPAQVTEGFWQMFGDLIRDFSSWRLDNLAALTRTYKDVSVFVTTGLDYDKWVYEASKASVAQQAELMGLISIVSNGRILPFVPFDPWRDVVENGASLTAVQTAVAQHGAVGVKLYPPMGFRASQNDQSFDDWQAGLAQDHLSAADFGKQLDAHLDALYTWCAENNVPILAHTGASNYSRPSAKTDADPQYWIAVLQKHPRLRINLSHFGGQEPEAAPWIQTIHQLFTGYQGVYADVACFDPTTSAGNGYWSRLKQLVDDDKNVAARLLYGSDWFLLADCAKPAEFEDTIRTTLSGALGAPSIDAIFGKNAVAFLGLARGDATRTRLDAFYDKYKVEAPWRASVDAHPRP